MSITRKRLGATTVVASTDTELYQVPVNTEAVVSLVQVCNRGTSERTFRVAVVDGDIASVANEDYLYYDSPVPANDALALRLGLAMEQDDSILVRADHADVNFLAFGIEETLS